MIGMYMSTEKDLEQASWIEVSASDAIDVEYD